MPLVVSWQTALLFTTLVGVTNAAIWDPSRFTTLDFMTTPPHGCVTDDGYHLRPGETRSMNCKFCSCDYPGGLSCYYYDCLSPMCVDAVSNGDNCCWTCPNGKNCKISQTGEVIPAGAPVVRGSLTCNCPTQDHSLPGTLQESNYIALCEDVTTIALTTIPSNIN